METLRNPGISFPVSGLAAIIVTGLLLYFNYDLSKIYVPSEEGFHPKPVSIPYTQTPEAIETEKTEDFTQKPISQAIRETTSVSTHSPVTTAPVAPVGMEKPKGIEITKTGPYVDFQIPYVPKHFTPEQVDQSPRVLKPVKPVYPYQATVHGIEGRVILRFIVDENGGVQNPEVVKAEPPGVFEEAALAAIVRYKFIPAKIGDRNVKCIAVMPVGFRID